MLAPVGETGETSAGSEAEKDLVEDLGLQAIGEEGPGQVGDGTSKVASSGKRDVKSNSWSAAFSKW